MPNDEVRRLDVDEPRKPGDLIGPGKQVIFHAARGHGAEARDFYEHPDRHDLLGSTGKEMMTKVAVKFGWESAEELDRYLAEHWAGSYQMYDWSTP